MVQDGRDPLSGERRSRRSFSESAPFGGLRNADTGGRTADFNALLAGVPGLIMGVALGFFLRAKYEAPLWICVLTPVVFAVGMSLLALVITNKAGEASSALYNPSGRTTPPKREYSYAESLVARGAYEDAVTAFELAVAEDASDPTPYLRIARTYRDHLERHEDAARWFRRALRESALAASHAAPVRKELVELYVHRMAAPAKAAPELARMAEDLAGTPEGTWAAEELAHVKGLMRGEDSAG